MEGGAVGHYIERGPPKDHPSQICFNLVQRFRGEDLKVIFYQNMSNLYNLIGINRLKEKFHRKTQNIC
jgi:predicted AAA+ superfamily ATPase